MFLATSTNILCERSEGPHIPMEQSIRACAEAGFTNLDFGFAELGFSSKTFHGDNWKEDILHYKQLAAQLGINFVQGHSTLCDFCNPSKTEHHDLEMVYRSIQGAHILGIPWLAVHPSTHLLDGLAAPDTHYQNVQFFKKLSDYALPYGVGIAIENMWGEACPGVSRYAILAEEVLRLIDDIDRENTCVCWDVEHASIEKLSQGDSIRLLGNRIKATHISDETGANNIHILPYTGFVKWDEVLQALADIGYENAFSLEIQHYLPKMPLSLCPEAMRLAYKVGTHLIKR